MPDTVHHVMWCTVYDAKNKSLPVRQHGQAQRVMSLSAHHHKNNIKQEVLQVLNAKSFWRHASSTT